MTAPRRAFVKKRLLRLLYLAAIIPLTLLFLLSSGIVLWQEISLRGEIADYAAALARDVGSCFDENRTGDLAAYEAFLDDSRPDNADAARKPSVIPGRAALFRRSGEVLWASKGGEVLRNSLATPPGKPAIIVRDGSPDFETSAVAVQPTNDPDVLAAASVSFHAWRAGKGVLALHVAMYALGTALFCIAFLQLLKRWLFSPLHTLAEEIRSLRWGRDIPRAPDAPKGMLHMEMDEVREFRCALTELAKQAVEKEALQNRYLGDLVRTQEEERSRLAREIHDGPVQIVSALVQRIQMASLEKDGRRMGDHLALAEEIAHSAVNDLRSVCDALSPPWLSLGLARCLEELAERLGRQHGVSVEADVRLDADPGPERTLAIFRICQEGVSNAVRHGKASAVTIRVREREGAYRLYVHDNGIGFDAGSLPLDRLRAEGRRGLNGARERAAFLGGRFAYRSSPGKGTALALTLPKTERQNVSVDR